MGNVYAVIMAGGVGSRFWPRSRERSPKQVLEIVGNGTMIQNTVRRIESFATPERMFIVTNKVQKSIIMQQLPHIPEQNILVEPVGKNTAPCIGLAAHWIMRSDPDGVMVVLPADHLIGEVDKFNKVLQRAIAVAEHSNSLITIGIHPTHPETGYGYIQYDDAIDHNPYYAEKVFRVKTFAEKPNYETAVKFLQSGDFLWNSGMFIWRASVILEEIQRLLPEIAEQLKKVAQTIGTSEYENMLELSYGMMRSISIDYGVMEKARSVYVVLADFGWSDVGSWDEVKRLTPVDDSGNAFRGTVIARDTTGNYVDAGNKLVALIGVKNLIVVTTDDAILICEQGRSQEVKEVVDTLKRRKMYEFL
ncbi:MAG: mannose-1-phosphate guanylyltransferase [Bacteroidetes bacterium]|nr:mannose-1-phosphate guanylyltransferase [Bacteroidota bacterium]